jgi:hypothetical protein
MRFLITLALISSPVFAQMSATPKPMSARRLQLLSALDTCERKTGVKLPRPPQHPTKEEVSTIRGCINSGIRFPEPKHKKNPQGQPTSNGASLNLPANIQTFNQQIPHPTLGGIYNQNLGANRQLQNQMPHLPPPILNTQGVPLGIPQETIRTPGAPKNSQLHRRLNPEPPQNETDPRPPEVQDQEN